MNALYSKKVAREILEESGALGRCVVVKKNGVFPAVARDKLMPEESRLLRWRPARVMTRPKGAPSVNDTPMLPPEFSGRELAAFMLAGAGALVADFFGDWEDGPDHASLERLDEDSGARQAVVDAFDAYREAVGKVGKRDPELDRRARESCTAYSNARSEALLQHRVSEVPQPQPGDSDTRRRELDAEYTRRIALVNADLAEQEAEMNRLQAEDKAAEQKWLHAMVAELLKHATNAAEPEVPPAPQPVPVVQPEAHAATALRETPMSRAGLVKAHIHHWPTIEADLNDAARKKLSVAKAGKRNWVESKALEWARAKGKLTDQPGASSQPSLADPMAAHYGQLAGLPRQTHTQ